LPQVWLLSATWLDHGQACRDQYLSFANLVAAAVYVCPLLYALVWGCLATSAGARLDLKSQLLQQL
jgi:hypothetical protein